MMGNSCSVVGIFGVALVGYAYRDDLSGVASRVFGELVRERGGRFPARHRHLPVGHRRALHHQSEVNGATVRTIFDTGASAVVLSHADAIKAGIATETLRYNIPVQTANGTGRAAGVTLDRIEVGGIAATAFAPSSRNRARSIPACSA